VEIILSVGVDVHDFFHINMKGFQELEDLLLVIYVVVFLILDSQVLVDPFCFIEKLLWVRQSPPKNLRYSNYFFHSDLLPNHSELEPFRDIFFLDLSIFFALISVFDIVGLKDFFKVYL